MTYLYLTDNSVIFFFQKAHTVIGFEMCKQAVEDARANAQLNGDCYVTAYLVVLVTVKYMFVVFNDCTTALSVH